MSVRYTATWYDVTQARQQDTHHTHRHVPARPAGLQFSHSRSSVARWQKFRPKSSKGATEKKFVAEFWLILPKTGRKGAAENFQKSSLFLAVITTYNVHQDKIKFDF
jgi:hypothetical protein